MDNLYGAGLGSCQYSMGANLRSSGLGLTVDLTYLGMSFVESVTMNGLLPGFESGEMSGNSRSNLPTKRKHNGKVGYVALRSLKDDCSIEESKPD